jgi:hypothetical protein
MSFGVSHRGIITVTSAVETVINEISFEHILWYSILVKCTNWTLSKVFREKMRKFPTLPPICISPSSFVYLLAVCIRLLAASVYRALRILPPKSPPSQIGVWIMRSPLWYFIFFYSVQSSQQSQCDTACVQFPNDRFQMNSHSLRHPSSEVDLHSRPRLSQTSMMNKPKDQWPLIPEHCFITRPTRMAFPQQSLGVLSPEEAMR